MIINDKEYHCWHEVGHAIACMISKGYVVSIELTNNPTLPYLAKASCQTPETGMKLHTSAGGLAAEYMLYTKKLIIIEESAFWGEAIKNAEFDIKKFFNNEIQDEEQCLEIFIDYAKQLSEDLLPFIEKMESIVNKLIEKNKLTGDEIVDLLNN